MDTYRRAHNLGKKAVALVLDPDTPLHSDTTCYAPSADERRQINSAHNNQFADLPIGWKAGSCAS